MPSSPISRRDLQIPDAPNDFGDVHEVNEPASKAHWKVDPDSSEEKENEPDRVVVVDEGVSVNETTGGVASTVHE